MASTSTATSTTVSVTTMEHLFELAQLPEDEFINLDLDLDDKLADPVFVMLIDDMASTDDPDGIGELFLHPRPRALAHIVDKLLTDGTPRCRRAIVEHNAWVVLLVEHAAARLISVLRTRPLSRAMVVDALTRIGGFDILIDRLMSRKRADDVA